MAQLHEDAARFIRQRLIALEQGREEDAEVLRDFIREEFGLTIRDVYVDDVPEQTLERWRNVYGLPSGVKQVSCMVQYLNEPVWRIPMDLEKRAPSPYETPLHMLSLDPLGQPEDETHTPEHLRRRTGGPLPEEVEAALRPYRAE